MMYLFSLFDFFCKNSVQDCLVNFEQCDKTSTPLDIQGLWTVWWNLKLGGLKNRSEKWRNVGVLGKSRL